MSQKAIITASWCLFAAATLGCTGVIDGPVGTSADGGTGGGAPAVGGSGGAPSAGSSGIGGAPSAGSSGSGGTPSAGSSGSGSGGAPPIETNAAPASGRRLTRNEYLNTIADVLEIETDPLKEIVLDDGGGSGFRNARIALLPSANRTDAYEQAAIHVAENLPQSTIARFASCQDPAEPCTSGFVSALGRLLYRRPLTEAEVSKLTQLFAVAGSEGDGFETGARLVVQAMLQSPAFLYRLERTDRIEPATSLSLVDAFEMASRWSYLLWQSAPDAALLDAAAQGALDDGAVTSMLASPKTRRGVRTFFDEWLALYKLENTQRDSALYPEFSPAAAREMREETLGFFEKLLVDERAPFFSAYTSQTASFGPDLAELYGVAADAAEHDWTSDDTRGGFLTQAGVLTAHTVVDSTSIVDRGLFVLRSLLCDNVPPPPAGAAQTFAMVDETLPQRVRFEQHRADPACNGCHAVFDPLGNPFEAYNAIGRFQTTDKHGNPIQRDGSLTLDNVDHTYSNLEEFSAILAQSPQTEQCMVKQLTSYSFGRALESDDNGLVSRLTTRFRERTHDFLGLLEEVARSPAYRYVARDDVAPAEVEP